MRTLIIIKPDAVQRGLIGEILHRFEYRGIKVAALKMLWIDKARAKKLYDAHKGKPFFDDLVGYITSSPIVVGILEAENVIPLVRKMLGTTNPADADLGTIRGDFALRVNRNIIHASDSKESAKYEIPIFFDESEIIDYKKIGVEWI
ncbi:MAG: nucleoside-diphosphate kinase [Candidatus Altiarchaeales archaeon IMC4]|nr:MAG: nucleoside-diphosphate kinase [Candidatus Altiarchaeales archaeon IMC4]